MKKNVIIFILGILFFASCTRKNESRLFHFESIESTHPIKKKFTLIPTKIMLGAPYQIKVIDSLALIVDKLNDKTLLIFNLKNNTEVKRFLAVGRGPGEVLSPITIEYQNDSLYILDRQTLSGRILVFSLTDIIQGTVKDNISYHFPRARTITKTNNGFLTSGPFKDNLIHEYDAKYDSIPIDYNFYPEFILQSVKKEFDRYLIGQGDIVMNRNNLLITYAFLGDIKFYHKSGRSYKPISHYSFGNSEPLKNRIMQNNYKIQPNDIMYFNYGSSCASKDAFYVLFDGHYMRREAPKDYSILMKFDINGDFVESYHLNASIVCYTVTDNNMIYAITMTPELDYALSKIQL